MNAYLQPNMRSYSSIINTCAQKADVERAEQWFCWMEKAHVQPNVVSYGSVINACAQKGDGFLEHGFARMRF